MAKSILSKFKINLTTLKTHGHHIIFFISIISLGSLVIWWSIFIHNSIRQHRLYRYDMLERDLKLLSLRLGTTRSHQPSLGVLQDDNRFEVVVCVQESSRFTSTLVPQWPQLCLKVRPEFLGQIEKETNRLNLMLVGEAGVLILVVFVSSVFLYRFIRLERRTAREVKVFFERSAHEIKTPISGIKAFLENLKAGAVDSKNLMSYVDMALRTVKRQEQLAENILSGYKLEERKIRLKCTGLDLAAFVEDYLDENSFRFTEAKIIFNYKKKKRITVKADTNALKVILDNITDNAIKYCDCSPVLKVDCIISGAKAVVVIKDNGPGFKPHFHETIFNAYKQLDEELPMKRQGAGLGLYISRKLARKMGGDLEAHSEGEGKGAEFRIILPRISENEE